MSVISAKKTAKYQSAISLIEQGLSVEQCAQALGISPKSLARWIADPTFAEMRAAQDSPSETLATVERELRSIGLDHGVAPYARVHALRALASIVAERETADDINQRLDRLEEHATRQDPR